MTSDHPNFKFMYSSKKGPQNLDSDLYYYFHNDYGHDTNKCRHLKDAIERMLHDGHPVEFVKKEQKRSNKRKDDGYRGKEQELPKKDTAGYKRDISK